MTHRKIIQLTGVKSRVVALCDDNTLWTAYLNDDISPVILGWVPMDTSELEGKDFDEAMREAQSRWDDAFRSRGYPVETVD